MDFVRKFIHKWSWTILLLFCFVGIVFPLIGSIALICMLSPVVVAFFRGRMWCGNFCPRGSFNDIILSKFSRKKGIPKMFKEEWFKVIFLVLLMGAFAVQLVLFWGDAVAIGSVFIRMIIITTLLAVILGITYNQRTWCVICPMGNMASYVSRLERVIKSSKHVTFKQDKCVNCKLCNKSCPIEIPVLDHKNKGRVLDSNCLKCEVCVDKCPKKALFRGGEGVSKK